jgi:uncharacterized protein (TIGR00255 family)
MTFSMTGFAAVGRETEYGALSLELRAVNHRYLEIQFRMPDELRALETTLREGIVGRISRGKVDCRVGFSVAAQAQRGAPLNAEALADLLRHAGEVRAVSPESPPLSVADILRWPGVFGLDVVPIERISVDLAQLLDRALDDMTASRAREGEKLKALLLDRVAEMERIAAEVKPMIPQLVTAYREKLLARLAEAMAGKDDDRLRQEIILYASRIDVDEELSRLVTHLAEVRRVLAQPAPAGKRLDFLMQELNREANTLGSKSVANTVSQASIDLKILIEQMREQIQNIE